VVHCLNLLINLGLDKLQCLYLVWYEHDVNSVMYWKIKKKYSSLSLMKNYDSDKTSSGVTSATGGPYSVCGK